MSRTWIGDAERKLGGSDGGRDGDSGGVSSNLSVSNCDRGSTFTGSKVAEAAATEMVLETAMADMMAKLQG